MIIKKIFNNNSILATDYNKTEFVVLGCGIAFKKSVGEEVDNQFIEKVFILKEKEASEKFKILLEDVPINQISLCHDIIEYAKNILDIELNEYIYVTLTDHINHTLMLHDKGLIKPNILTWEIKNFYPDEFKIGLKLLDFIKSELGYELNEDEAGSIALHIINAQVNTRYIDSNYVFDMTKKLKDIVNIVIYTFNKNLNINSLNYDRFITHLRFFLKRLNKRENYFPKDNFLLNQVKVKYKKAYQCTLKIEKYLELKLNEDEKLYLTLHIQRVTQR